MLEETAALLSQSSAYLQELFSCDDKAHRELCKLIKAEEVKGDKVTKQYSRTEQYVHHPFR